jgi:hypothetical protein
MKHFSSIDKLDTGILYALELASSISVLLLAFGLVASMANVLTKGSVLTDSPIMRQIWAWTQCLAIDASVAGTIIRTFHYHHEGEKVKTWLYGVLSLLLLFTAAIVSNIEAVQQTLNVTLDAAYSHVFVSIEALTWIRSIAIVLLIVAHAMRHVQIDTPQETEQPQPAPSLKITPDLIETLRILLTQTTVTEEANTQQLLLSQGEQGSEQKPNTPPEATTDDDEEPGANNGHRVKAYLLLHPDAKVRDVAEALSISTSTANKWIGRVRTE